MPAVPWYQCYVISEHAIIQKSATHLAHWTLDNLLCTCYFIYKTQFYFSPSNVALCQGHSQLPVTVYPTTPGVRCCFWLNLSFDLSLHKSCLNFWLKSEIRLKSETAPHPRSNLYHHTAWESPLSLIENIEHTSEHQAILRVFQKTTHPINK